VKPRDRAFAELLIDCEEGRTLRAVLVGMLREPTDEPQDSSEVRSRLMGSARGHGVGNGLAA
jgi:hypothetical protein